MAEPFLIYLTIFKSRLALGNLVVGITGFANQPTPTIIHRIRQTVNQRQPLSLDDPANAPIFDYLLDKGIVSAGLRSKGRYRAYSLEQEGKSYSARGRTGEELSSLPAYVVDVWMSDEALPSTIGAPTPDNCEEVLEFAFQLRLLSRAKHTWTASGHLLHALRHEYANAVTNLDNPFLLGASAPVLLRQVIETDGLVLREVIRELIEIGDFATRDQIASRFDVVVQRATDALDSSAVGPPDLRKAQMFLKLIRETMNRRANQSRAPGVLEHRVSPRLEWLTDLGYLRKGPFEKNRFKYRVTPAAHSLLGLLDEHFGSASWSDEVAVEAWRRNPTWEELRSLIAVREPLLAYRASYRILKRRIGPTPIREVAFAAALMTDACGYPQMLEGLKEFARVTSGASLSGGRYTRNPENVFLPDAALEGTE